MTSILRMMNDALKAIQTEYSHIQQGEQTLQKAVGTVEILTKAATKLILLSNMQFKQVNT